MATFDEYRKDSAQRRFEIKLLVILGSNHAVSLRLLDQKAIKWVIGQPVEQEWIKEERDMGLSRQGFCLQQPCFRRSCFRQWLSRCCLFLIVTFVLLFVQTNKVQAVTQVEIIADDNYPPFSYRKGFHSVGLYPQILNAVFAKMPKYQVIIRPLPWRRGLTMMRMGTGFAIFPPYYFPEKRPYLAHYSAPLLQEQVTLFCSRQYLDQLKVKLNKETVHWPDDFEGAVIGINPGYLLLDDAFWQRHRSGFYRIEEGINNRKNLLKVASGRMSCLVNSRMSVFWDLQNLVQEKADILADEIVQVRVLNFQQGYLAFSLDKLRRYSYRSDFIRSFEQAFNELKSSGELQKIVLSFEQSLRVQTPLDKELHFTKEP